MVCTIKVPGRQQLSLRVCLCVSGVVSNIKLVEELGAGRGVRGFPRVAYLRAFCFGDNTGT